MLVSVLKHARTGAHLDLGLITLPKGQFHCISPTDTLPCKVGHSLWSGPIPVLKFVIRHLGLSDWRRLPPCRRLRNRPKHIITRLVLLTKSFARGSSDCGLLGLVRARGPIPPPQAHSPWSKRLFKGQIDLEILVFFQHVPDTAC